MSDTVRPDRWKILPIILLSPFMGCLDGSIVNVALPTMARSLGTDLAGVQWVVSSYLIVVSAFVLIFGKIADKIGKTRVFVLGFLVFGLGSALCALSWSLPILIAARCAQAIGAAMFMSSNQGIIASIFPPEERGRALGFSGTTVAIGSMVGPPLGGIMVDFFSWQSLFIINVPIAAFAFIAGAKLLPKDEEVESLAGFDLSGSALFVATAVAFFLFLLNGTAIGWASPLELACLCAALACGTLFVLRELRAADPMLDLSIFRDGLFSMSVGCVTLVFVASYCVSIAQPFYLQELLGLSPSAAGLILLATPLASGFVAPLAGHIADKLGAWRLTIAALAIQVGALILMLFLKAGSSLVYVALCLFVSGVGGGAFSSPNTKLIMACAPKGKLGIAGSVNALARNVGMVMGIALAVSLLGAGGSSAAAPAAGAATDPAGFVRGMRLAFGAAALCALVAMGLSLVRAASRSSEDAA